jgi:hypothetical protein
MDSTNTCHFVVNRQIIVNLSHAPIISGLSFADKTLQGISQFDMP